MSWTIKKAEHQRIDAFELWCWRRLLRVPWTARRSNQSILKEMGVHWKNWCWSWNSNTLAMGCEELTHLKRPWCWERLRAGGEGDDQRWDGWMVSPTQWSWVGVNSRSWRWTGRPGVLQSMGWQRVGHDWATEPNWTEEAGRLEGGCSMVQVNKQRASEEATAVWGHGAGGSACNAEVGIAFGHPSCLCPPEPLPVCRSSPLTVYPQKSSLLWVRAPLTLGSTEEVQKRVETLNVELTQESKYKPLPSFRLNYSLSSTR